MAKDKKKQEHPPGGGMKPGWEVTFVAENILVQALAIYIANNNGELPPEDMLHKMTESCVKGSVFFNNNKKKYGIHDRITDGINDEEE